MNKATKIGHVGFWRRLAALWVDLFVVYSVSKFFIELLSIPGFRISFETFFIVIAALYSAIMLIYQRRTVGKMLLQIMVESKTNEPVHFRDILLREVFCKWGAGVALPFMLGRLLAGNVWLSTISDLMILIPLALLNIIYFMFAKNTWYDDLSGLIVVRNPSAGKIRIGFYAVMIAAILGIGTGLFEYLTMNRVPCRMAAFRNAASTKPFVNFLKVQKSNPVDYVIGLLEKYDVVVLCERAHPEMTQWDFIYDVVRDPRFIAKAGHVFTEYGQVGMQDYLDKFMMTDSLNEREIHDRILHIMRNMPVWPSWTNYNLYQYLNRLYHLNQTLLPGNRIRHHFTDAAVDWSAITTFGQYKEYQKKYIWNRDEIMAETIIREMDRLSRSGVKPAKCLVVMNYRHAMDLTDRLPGEKRVNTYEFLKDSFGNRAANVLINTRIIVTVPVASGVWDDAFEESGNKPLGFNFQGSPFGACFFDMFPFNFLFQLLKKGISPSANGSLRYQDVFTGFVFTHPVKDQYFQSNTPGYFDGFEAEYIRRSACLGDEFKDAAKLEMISLKGGSAESITKQFDFRIETAVELFFYSFAGVGFLIGIGAFIFRRRKNAVEEIFGEINTD